MKWSDGNIGIGYGLKICIPSLVKDELSTPDPIVLLPPWIHLLYDRTPIMGPSPLLCNLIGFDLFFLEIGDVDIEKSILWKPLFKNMLCYLHSKTGSGVEFEMTP